ncbi:MAG: sugar ABC transporter substrate-binding protein [Alkaliphilus sp.]
MKKISVLLLVVAMIFSMVGCGNNGAQDSASQEQVTLTLLGWGGAEEETTVQNYLQEFYKENPNIKVEFVRPGDYWVKLKTMISGGTAPDVFYMGFPEFVEFHNQGVLLDLSPFAEKSKVFNRKDFREDQLMAFSNRDTSKLYGVPKDWSAYVIYYNKEMFDAAGIPTPSELHERGEWTYDKFVEVARKLTNDNHHGAAINFGRWKSLIPQMGANWVSDDASKVTINTTEFAKALQWLADLALVEKVIPTFEELQEQSPPDRFSNQKAAMFMSGRWMAMRFRDVDFEWNVAPIPSDKEASTWVDLVAYVASEDTEHPEAAWKLIEFLTGAKVQNMVAESGHAIPSRVKIANSPAFLDSIGGINNEAFLEIDADVLPVFDNWGRIWDAMKVNFESVWTGQRTAKEAVKETQKEIDNLSK